MFFNNLKYELLTSIRARDLIIWLMIFPVVLGTLMKIAFGSIYENDVLFQSIPTAVVENEKNEIFHSIIDEIENSENPLLKVSYLSEEEAMKALEDDEVVGNPSLPSHPDNALYKKYFPDGGGSIFTFEIKGGKEDAWRFIDNLKIFSLLANVADVKSLVIHPASTTHSQMTPEELEQQHITPTTIRLSIGVEHIDDIIADLDQAFDSI